MKYEYYYIEDNNGKSNECLELEVIKVYGE
jgi:hypothetical protein